MTDFKFPATLVEGPVSTIVAFNAENKQNPVFMTDSTNPNFDGIIQGLRDGDDRVWDWFNPARAMVARFMQITDRITWNGKELCLDGDPVHNSLTDHVVRMIEAGQDGYEAIVKFWEKLESNPNQHSRQQAFDWLASHKFKIDESGDLVAYKGVYKDGEHFISNYASTVSGKPSAFIDGEPVPPLSKVPNRIGTVVTMPRSEVIHDPRQACRRGLHVGSWEYAKDYGNAMLEVRVNPRDIVSVPTDGGGEKVRVCRYYIVEARTAEREGGPIVKPEDVTERWSDVGYEAF
jgi:hypothetical protein